MSKASGSKSAPKPRKRKANGWKFPEKLPKGEVLTDSAKKEWILGESIGQGGFGEIYCAADGSSKTPSDWPYVIKIEPHENGPLFMEKNFYIKVAKPDDLKAWKQKEGIKLLGMPVFYGSGTHFHDDTKYRFLVMERYGKDLWSLFKSAKSFPPHTVYRCALQIIDTLRYIHSKDYVHGDIKGANLLLGRKPGTENQVFLVDFGLACKYSQKEFQKDPKQAHNGTIEYTSCDWHLGVPTRRGDLEILGFNLLHWIAGHLPWEKDIAKKEIVHKKKQELMSDVEGYINKNFSNIPKAISAYLSYVSKLKYNEEPNYKYCKELFTKELKQIGSSQTGPLEFEATKLPSTPSTSSNRRVSPRKSSVKAKPPTFDSSGDENEVPPAKPKPARNPRATKAKPKAKDLVQNDADSDDEPESPVAPRRRQTKSKTTATKKLKTSATTSKEVKK